MLEKHGSYYADWRDAKGNRKRKAFPSKSAALAFTREMREQLHQPANPSKPTRRKPLLKRRGRGSKRKGPTRTSGARSVH